MSDKINPKNIAHDPVTRFRAGTGDPPSMILQFQYRSSATQRATRLAESPVYSIDPQLLRELIGAMQAALAEIESRPPTGPIAPH